MSINYTPRTWVTGEVVTAAYMNNEIGTPFTGLQAAWTAWTPQLIANTTNPNLGSTGTAVGRYSQTGKTLDVYGTFIFGGSGISAGSGTYNIQFGSIMSGFVSITALYTQGTLWHTHSASVGMGLFIAQNNAGLTYAGCYTTQTAADGLANMNNASPWVWGSGDRLAFAGTIETP